MPWTSKKARVRKPTNIVGSFHETAPGKTRDKPVEPVVSRRLVAMIRAALCDPLVRQGRLVGPLTLDIVRRFGGGTIAFEGEAAGLPVATVATFGRPPKPTRMTA